MMDAHLVAEWPGFRLDVRIAARDGEVVALAGGEGVGKTTALRVLAGLQPSCGGYLTLDGVPMNAWPAGRRPVAMVAGEPLLFPHLTVLENVAFGPRCHGASRAAARHSAAIWLEQVGLSGRHHARPRDLTPGESHRVALARALAVRPRLLLLDEPLTTGTLPRPRAHSLLRHHLAAFPGACVLTVTDPADAAPLSTRILILHDGVPLREMIPPGP
ncbi:ATP-binding cassette domain-containing protein [Sphaerisporangium sp. B11E5]|uniref:ATP-binding cassette domain-containing protein n=1 Tax=Sphaerisporangium sp. B11E5 TaxID=3153563 RepID=UPI00325F32D4